MRHITATDDFSFKVEIDVREIEIIMDSLSRTIYHYDLKLGNKEELQAFCYLYKDIKEAYDKKYPNSKITNKVTAQRIAEMTA